MGWFRSNDLWVSKYEPNILPLNYHAAQVGQISSALQDVAIYGEEIIIVMFVLVICDIQYVK